MRSGHICFLVGISVLPIKQIANKQSFTWINSHNEVSRYEFFIGVANYVVNRSLVSKKEHIWLVPMGLESLSKFSPSIWAKMDILVHYLRNYMKSDGAKQ